MQAGCFVEIFSAVKDPRVERTKKHLFLEIIGMSLFAVLAGAQGYTEIADFCKHHHKWLKNYFVLPHGTPSHDTFSRVFSAVDADAFQESFLKWVQKVVELFPENVVALDGKSIRSSRREKKHLDALHIVSAWSCKNGMTLGQIKVDAKSNEITVIPLLLKKLFLKGAIVTMDAMGCQRKIAQGITDQGADYLLRVKANQGGLLEAMEHTFQRAEAGGYENMVYYTAKDETNNDHGRLESRRCVVLPLMYLMQMKIKWKGLKSVVLVVSERETEAGKTVEHRYYISSLDPKDPVKILHSIRAHWQIENNLHWALDVSWREDQSRIRDENGALNMTWLRKTCLTLLKRATHVNGSIRRKQLAIWANPEYAVEIAKI